MPPILEILSFVTLAMRAAPTVQKIAVDGAKMVKDIMSSGQVSVEQQNKINDWADAHQAATLAGEVPPELTIEADPVLETPPMGTEPTVPANPPVV